MKKFKGVDEIHEIMEKIYEEEKDMTPEQRVKKIKEESDKFMVERKLVLKRIKTKKLKHLAV